MIDHLKIRNFTAFDELETGFVPGVNVFVGANGTGKTHVLKLLYSFLHTSWNPQASEKAHPGDKLLRIFRPEGVWSRLIKKGEKEAFASCRVGGETLEIRLKKGKDGFDESPAKGSLKKKFKPVYIPVKEMLANAPGFRSLYAERETHFEEVYADIIDKAFIPPLKQIDRQSESLMKILGKRIGGKIVNKNEVFFLKTGRGEIEFTLVAEGVRKLALLWLLIRNGSLGKGSTLFWDEPETNLNPSMLPLVVEILYGLERIGVQTFVATHSYVLCKEFELRRKENSLRYYSIYPEETGRLALKTSDAYHTLSPNRIADQFARMYGMEVGRALGGDYG